MSIERKCENCKWGGNHLLTICDTIGVTECRYFRPNEKLVRADERSKLITMLKRDLENCNGVLQECEKERTYLDQIYCLAVKKYIQELIELLEKEK